MTISSHLFIHFWPFMFSKLTKRVFSSPIFGILLPISERRLKEMRKIFAGVVLPLLTATAIIGSGFSLWWFSPADTQSNTLPQTLNGEVTSKYGDITGYSWSVPLTNLRLVYDQSTSLNDRPPAAGAPSGVHFEFANDTLAARTITLTQTQANIDAHPTVTTTIKVPAALDKYIEIKSKTQVAPTPGREGTAPNNLITYVFTWPEDAWTTGTDPKIDWNFDRNVAVSWRTIPNPNPNGYLGEPKDKTAYETFSTVAEANNIVIEYKAGYN